MKKLGKVKRIAASALIAGLAAGIPVAGVMPSPVFAAETEDIAFTLKQSEGGTVSSSASGSVKTGEVFDIHAVAGEGYRFAHWNLRSNGYHEIVSGSEGDSSISVKVHESEAGLFTAEAVFVKADLHMIQSDGFDLPEFARTGDVLDLSVYKESSYNYEDDEGYYFGRDELVVIRTSDGADITDDVYDRERGIITMPDTDIAVSREILKGYVEKVLDNMLIIEDTAHTIKSFGINLPESADAGDVLDVSEYTGYGYYREDDEAYYFGHETLNVYRADDHADITAEVYNSDTGTITMPDADIEVVRGMVKGTTQKVPDIDVIREGDTDSITGSPDTDEEYPDGNDAADESGYKEKVLDFFQIEEGGGGTESVAATEVEKENTEEAVTAGRVQEKAASVSAAASVTAEAPSGVTLDRSAAASVRAEAPSGVTLDQSAAASVSAGALSSPVTVRAEGASTVTSNPATGDYNVMTAFTMAAVAAGAGIAVAAYMLKRKTR